MDVQAVFLRNVQIPHCYLKHTNGEFILNQPWFTPSNVPRGNHLQIISVKVFNKKLYFCCRTNSIPSSFWWANIF